MDLLRALLQNPSGGTQYPRSQPDTLRREPSPDIEIDDSTTVDPLDALRALKSSYNEDLSDEVRLIGGRTLDECRVDSAASLAAHPLPSSYIQAPRPSTPGQTTLNSPSPTPVALSGPRTAENIKLLYHICQARAVQPDFHFQEIGMRHRVSLRLGDTLIEDEPGRTYGSKKEGKEVLAGKGLEVLKMWQMEETRANEAAASMGKERNGIYSADKVPETVRATQVEAVMAWNQENWVGQLLEHSHSAATSEPVYQPYQLTLHTFACTVTIAARPSESFGSPSTAYASKKIAKAMAARAAMLWLRSENRIGTSPARKKVKLENGLAENHNTPNANGTNSNGPNANASPLPSPSASVLDVVDSAGPSTFANQVHQLAHLLGLTSPEYRLIAAPNTAMYSGALYFKDGTGVLVGALGEISGVYGKKAAKEECARAVVEILREEVRRRQRLAGVLP